MNKDYKEKAYAGLASGASAAAVKELLNIDATGGSTNDVIRFLDNKVKTPHKLNYHLGNFATKRLPTVGLSTLGGMIAYDLLQKDKKSKKFKDKIVPALGAGAISTAMTLPITYKTNAFPKELEHLTGSKAVRTILKNRFGQAALAAPAGFLTYDYIKDKTKQLGNRSSSVLAGIASGIAGSAVAIPLMTKYEGLNEAAELRAKNLGERIGATSIGKRFLQAPTATGILKSHHLGRIITQIKNKIPAGIAGAAASYTVYDMVKNHFEKNKK
jgi:putative copper export protein